MTNNYTPESIYSLLSSGKTPDELAKEFTDSLNEALNLQKEEEKRRAVAEEARRKADEARKKKEELKARQAQAQIKDTEDLITYVKEYLAEYYPNVKINMEVSAEQLIELIENFLKVRTTFGHLWDHDFWF